MNSRNLWLAITACGFGCMLSLSAFTLWGISALLTTAGTWPWAVRELTTFCLPANVGTFFAYGLAATRWPRLSLQRPTPLACLSLALGAASLLGAYSGLLPDSPFFELAGLLLGSGGALAFICWELTFAMGSLDDARRAILIASAFSALPYCLLAFAPPTIMVVALSAGLVPICILCLGLSHRLLPLASRTDTEAPTPNWRGLWANLWAPLACTMMVGVIGPAVGSFATLEPINIALRTLLYQFANLLTVGILAFCWFRLKVRPTLESVFLVLVPIAVVVLFLFPFWSHGYQGAVLAFGCFIFSFVSILMMMLCIELSHEHGVGLGAVYGIFAGGTYLAQILGGSLARVVSSSTYPKQIQVIAVVALLLWGLSAIGLLAMWHTRSKKVTTNEPAAPASEEPANKTADSLASRCAALSRSHNLTPREVEVLELIGRGRDVGAIAEILCLSRNTVRTHIQRLYADLSVHTRQELIDLLEQTEAEGHLEA